MDKYIPVRYKGDHEVTLSEYGGPYRDAYGNPLKSRVLHKGDTLMVREHEVHGFTVLHDPRHEKDPEILGVGRVIKEEHKDKNDIQLSALGYQFHAGSPLWEPIEKIVETVKKAEKTIKEIVTGENK